MIVSVSPLLELPAELRIRIYEHALQHQRVLQRPLRASAWRTLPGDVANVSLLCTCKLVNEEAADVFCDLNSFRISYHHLCTCENRYPYPTFNAKRIRQLEVIDFMPRIDLPHLCDFCHDNGSGLLKSMTSLPRLTSLKVAFDDLWSFADFAPTILERLHESAGVHVTCDQVGRLVVHGLTSDVEIQLPVLHSAWLHLVESRRGHSKRAPRLPGEQSMQRALEYLQFEANTYERTSRMLKPFFASESHDEPLTLKFKGLPEESRRRADFTIALVGVMNDIFTDDGGSESIDWVDLDSFYYGGRWQFDEGVAGLVVEEKTSESPLDRSAMDESLE
ncbi:hypothetical protein Tdes44962_MAKER00049 [Teratosphaeria destructans]|uniref:F-box domain-containing protein n=1 Tax=Teratosphaeria destructans TaxID=418781 RepID=A0A9W7W784_9PEZI|nr:hypothetical protein Tdes44962_MAKER00049 [Teratosphaeria destructans]